MNSKPEKQRKIEKLKCGCRKGICTCDPDRVWPPYCCEKCPMMTPKPEKKQRKDILEEAELDLKLQIILDMRFGDGSGQPNLQIKLAKEEIKTDIVHRLNREKIRFAKELKRWTKGRKVTKDSVRAWANEVIR